MTCCWLFIIGAQKSMEKEFSMFLTGIVKIISRLICGTDGAETSQRNIVTCRDARPALHSQIYCGSYANAS